MKPCSFSHLTDRVLLRELAALNSQDRATTAALLACIAEVDLRKLYLPAAHPSMYSYCLNELHMSEDVAFKRIRAARAARRFPGILEAVAEGRLHLAAVVLLAPHLKPDNADELLAAAEHRTKAETELLIAQRFPQPDLPTLMQAVAPGVPAAGETARPTDAMALQLAPATEPNQPESMEPLAPGPVVPSVSTRIAARMEPLPPHAKLTPLSADRVAWQLTVERTTHEKLLHAKALLAHAVPSGDLEQVLDRALDALIEKLEKQKFAKCARSSTQRGSTNPRYIPARVRRAVSQRDGGQCTFVSEQGKRCEARERLEFDHAQPVARGGQATIDGMRLRCRAHNQYEADRAYGAGFMQAKREQAQRKSADANARAQAAAKLAAEKEITPWLRSLGFSAQEARRGAELCAHMPDASIEARVRVAVQGLAPACVRTPAPVASAPA